MRKVIKLIKPVDGIVRLMIYNNEFGSYLFGYKDLEDSSSVFDIWFESEIDALENCESKYGLRRQDWDEIKNPENGCQHDWINPVRIKGSQNGKPEFGSFEKLINGEWVEIKYN